MALEREKAADPGDTEATAVRTDLHVGPYHARFLDVHRLTVDQVESLARHAWVFAEQWAKERGRITVSAIAPEEMTIALDVFRDIVHGIGEGGIAEARGRIVEGRP